MTGMELVHVPGLGHGEGARRKGPGSGSRSDEKFAIEQRRVRVAALYLAKQSERMIARQLQVSRGTIRKDIVAIRKAWRERAAMDYDAVVAEEIAKMEGMERGLIPKAFLGQSAAVNDLLKLMDRRARLLGLDQPTRIEAKVEHVEVEAKRERAKELLDTAADDELAQRRAKSA